MTRESAIRRVFWQFAICFSVVLLAPTWSEVSGRLSLRAMIWIGALLSLTAWIFLTINFIKVRRQYPPTELSIADAGDPAMRKKIIRSMRFSQGGMIIMPLFLVNGLLTTNGEPVAVMIIGIAINLGFTWMFFKAYRNGKAKLQKLDATLSASTFEPQRG